jgi:hypothetical protein
MALALVRTHGHPSEAAARYQPPRAIIDPADSRSFVRAALIGTGALILLGALGRLQPSLPGTAEHPELLEALEAEEQVARNEDFDAACLQDLVDILMRREEQVHARLKQLDLQSPRESDRAPNASN